MIARAIKRHRPWIGLAAAMLLPILILSAVQLYSVVNARRHELEDVSRSRAGEVMHLVDARLESELRLGSALASATALKNGDIDALYRRSQEIAEISGTWRTVRLSDALRRKEIFQLGSPPTQGGRPIAPYVATAIAAGLAKPVIGDVVLFGPGDASIPINFPVLRNGRLKYVLTIELDPRSIDRLAATLYPPQNVVSGVVDQHAHFVSRSLKFADLVGRPGSSYLLRATQRGGSGLYRAITLEGAPTVTAYVTSPFSGWSTHVAVPSSAFDLAKYWSGAIWVVVTVSCVSLAGLLAWITIRNATLARAEDTRLQQSLKMEAIGRLTGGIAHDFNNLLTAIIGGIDLVLHKSDPSDRNRRYLEAALEAAERGTKLTSRLLAFSRTQQLGLEAVDLASILEGMSDLLDQSLGGLVRIKVNLDPQAIWVTSDRNQLELALLNIAVNARDAMPNGGQLTFTTEPAVLRRNGKTTPGVALRVTDTGEGMPAEVADHAFEPFFTTKDVNRGTGLGLAQVYTLMRQCNGEAAIESQVGLGTTVTLTFTAAVKCADPNQDSSTGKTPSSIRPARIMVLDDDNSVRSVVVDHLRSRGHVVFETATGEEALAALSKFDPELVVLDFAMPGMNGAETARLIRAERPSQRLLLISGYLNSLELDASIGDVPILKKPFDGRMLHERVVEILGSQRASEREL